MALARPDQEDDDDDGRCGQRSSQHQQDDRERTPEPEAKVATTTPRAAPPLTPNMRVGEGVASVPLHEGAGRAERRPDGESEDGAGQSLGADDGGLGALRAEQGGDDVVGGDVVRADQDAGYERAHEQDGNDAERSERRGEPRAPVPGALAAPGLRGARFEPGWP